MKKLFFLGILAWVPISLISQTVLNIQHPISSTTVTAQSSLNPADYQWSDPGNDLQGVSIYLPPATQPFTTELYLQQTKSRLSFSLSYTNLAFHKIELSYDGGSYIKVFESSSSTNPRQNYGWVTPPSSLMIPGTSHTLDVRYQDQFGNTFNRNYKFRVIPDAQGFLRDNVTSNSNFYRNKLTYWEGSIHAQNPNKVMLLVSGFDALNITPAAFYRLGGNELFQKFMNLGYRVYVLTFAFNAQDVKRNAAVTHSAIEYISSLHGNTDIIVAGASMGGVISRYTLAKDEETQKAINSTNYLPVSLFVSLDAPQQGAYLAVDLLQFMYDHDSQNSTLQSTAFQQLVRNNPNSSAAAVHQAFYNELSSLNDNIGYPTHCLTVGCAFSNATLTNPEVGKKWLDISANIQLGIGTIQVLSLESTVTGEGALPGSVLPPTTALNNDIITGADNDYLPMLKYANGLVVTTTNRYNRGPTFIPHFSALDLQNGVSPFCIEIYPTGNTELFQHAIIPTEIVEPLEKIISGTSLSNVGSGETYNFTKNTPQHILNDVDVLGNLVVNGNLPSGLTPGNGGAYPDPGSHIVVSTNKCDPSLLNVENGAHLYIGDQLNFSSGELRITTGSIVHLKTGSELKVGPGSSLIIEDGAILIIEQGASIELVNESSILEIKGKIQIGNDAIFTFTGDGHVVLDQHIGKFDANGIWTNAYDDYWEFGANSSIKLQGSSMNDLILVVKNSTHVRMDAGTKPESIEFGSGLIQIAKDQQFHMGSNLTMNSVKVESVDPNQTHGGIRFWNKNATINNCEFTGGNQLGALALHNIGGNKTVRVQYSDFYDNVEGLYVTGEGVDISGSRFENNVTGVQMDNMSRSAVISTSTFKFNNVGMVIRAQTGYSVNFSSNEFSNNTSNGLELISVESSVFSKNRFLSNAIGLKAYGSVVDLSQEAYNCFQDNDAGIHITANEGFKAGLYLVDGYNKFDLGTKTNGKYISGSTCSSPFLSVYHGLDINAENNVMPLIQAPFNPNQPSSQYILPVTLTYFNSCFGGNATATPIYLYRGAPLTSVAGACGSSSGGSIDDQFYEERTISLLGPGRIAYGGPFSAGLPLRDAILEGAEYISRSGEDVRDDELALDYMQAVLSQPGQNWTVEELRMQDLAYSLAKKAFTNLHQYNEEYIGLGSASMDDRMAFFNSYIAEKLNTLIQNGGSGTYAEFAWNLDKGQLYRAGNYYTEAIAHLNTASTWASGLEYDRASYWKCVCQAEKDYVEGMSNEEEFQIASNVCVSLYPNANFKMDGNGASDVQGYPVGTENTLNKMSRILPNPASDEVTVEMAFVVEEPLTIQITDVTGRVVYRETKDGLGRSFVVSVSSLSPGVYQLSLMKESGESYADIQQIVIQ